MVAPSGDLCLQRLLRCLHREGRAPRHCFWEKVSVLPGPVRSWGDLEAEPRGPGAPGEEPPRPPETPVFTADLQEFLGGRLRMEMVSDSCLRVPAAAPVGQTPWNGEESCFSGWGSRREREGLGAGSRSVPAGLGPRELPRRHALFRSSEMGEQELSPWSSWGRRRNPSLILHQQGGGHLVLCLGTDGCPQTSAGRSLACRPQGDYRPGRGIAEGGRGPRKTERTFQNQMGPKAASTSRPRARKHVECPEPGGSRGRPKPALHSVSASSV